MCLKWSLSNDFSKLNNLYHLQKLILENSQCTFYQTHLIKRNFKMKLRHSLWNWKMIKYVGKCKHKLAIKRIWLSLFDFIAFYITFYHIGIQYKIKSRCTIQTHVFNVFWTHIGPAKRALNYLNAEKVAFPF